MTRGRDRTDRNAWVYLANNGPSTYAELPNRPHTRDREDGVAKFNIKGNYHGQGEQGGGPKRFVYYIDGKHSERAVIEAWVDANPKTVAEVSDRSLNWRCPERFRDALKDVLDMEFESHHNGGAKPKGGTCPMCGEEYTRDLPDHLPECSEA